MNKNYKRVLLLFLFLIILIPNGKLAAAKTIDTKELENTDTNQVVPYLKHTYITMNKGTTYHLNITGVNTEAEIGYTSSDIAIVEVDNKGTLLAKADGSADIIILIKQNQLEYQLKATVTVSNYSTTKIQLDQMEASMVIGDKLSLTYQLIPADATDYINFTSDNETVATVSTEGVLTATKAGTATVTASLSNGEKATLTVVVKSILEKIEVLYIADNTFTLAIGQSRSLSYKLMPEKVTGTNVIWTSSDPSIATVNQDGRVTGKNAGEVQINMEADDGSGIKNTITLNVIKRGKGSNLSESGLSIVSIKKAKYTYSDMKQDLQSLESKYGDCIQVSILNKTYDKRNIYEVVLGNPNAKKHIVIQSTVHGREYMASLLTMKQIELYCKNYYTGMYQNRYYSELFDDVAFHILPMVNPDGVTISQFGVKGIRDSKLRKELEKMCKKYGHGKASYYTYWKANARGVDINRNFNSHWNLLNNGISSPGAYFYKGKFSESEIETDTLVNLVNRVKPTYTISYHATGSILYWYYGQTGTLKNKSLNLAKTVKSLTNYQMIYSFTKKNSAGFSDWVSIKKKIPAVTIEIGVNSCPLKQSEFNSIWKKNKLLYPVLADLGLNQ